MARFRKRGGEMWAEKSTCHTLSTVSLGLSMLTVTYFSRSRGSVGDAGTSSRVRVSIASDSSRRSALCSHGTK